MGIKVHKPTTSGRRKSSVNDFQQITAAKPFKGLIVSKKRMGGRNNAGKITVRHKGGGAKKFYRLVDFKSDKYDIEAKVETIEYDPNRSSWIALVIYTDGERRYVLALSDMEVGQKILSSQSKIEIKSGNRMPLKFIPSGTTICNIELKIGKGGEMVRSAGNSAQLMAIEDDWALVKLPSKEVRKVPAVCMATVGAVSNADHRLIRIGKAGRMRHRGIRPTVRGKAMNPVDHPHGGGEGSNPIGIRKGPKTKWGKLALGVKTRKKKKASTKYIIERRKKSK